MTNFYLIRFHVSCLVVLKYKLTFESVLSVNVCNRAITFSVKTENTCLVSTLFMREGKHGVAFD